MTEIEAEYERLKDEVPKKCPKKSPKLKSKKTSKQNQDFSISSDEEDEKDCSKSQNSSDEAIAEEFDIYDTVEPDNIFQKPDKGLIKLLVYFV